MAPPLPTAPLSGKNHLEGLGQSPSVGTGPPPALRVTHTWNGPGEEASVLP